MAAPRATQWIALRNLARVNRQQPVRSLHMTGPSTYASPVLARGRLTNNPTPENATVSTPVRHFNVSRELKAVGDSSTIDFAYLPEIDTAATGMDKFAQVRVPILPDNYSFESSRAIAQEVDEVVMKPEISTMSADAVFLPMADMHDGHAGGIDFHAMADRVAAGLRSMQIPVEKQAGMMKQLWNDMVDDVLGSATRKPVHL